jgi:MarR family transcriptional regulator, negative regulator of the multidrug operon emrRAB
VSKSSQALERVGALIQQAVRDDAARHGLLPVHLQVLEYLAHANRYSDIPIAVAEYLGVTRGTVSQTLLVLERKGLVTKYADDGDARRVRLKLTKSGQQILSDSWAHRLGDDLGGELATLLAALQRHTGHVAFGVCRNCTYFRSTKSGSTCGLTEEPLSISDAGKICREWRDPAAARP